MEKFIIRFVLCGVLFCFCLSVAVSGKNFEPTSCPAASFDGDLLNHPYPLDDKCVLLKHFCNLRQILYADLQKYPEKRFMLERKLKTVESKIDSINAAPFAFVRVQELAFVANVKNFYQPQVIDEFSPNQKKFLIISMAASLLISFCCLFVCWIFSKHSDNQYSYPLGICFCAFLVLSIIFGSLAF